MGLVVVIFGITQHEIIGAVTFVVLGIPLFGGLLTIRTRRTFAKAFAPGSVHTNSFGPDSMKVTGPLGSSEFRYAGYQIVWTGKGAVVLRRRDPAILMVFPAVLFPPAAVAHVRAQIAATDRPAGGRNASLIGLSHVR